MRKTERTEQELGRITEAAKKLGDWVSSVELQQAAGLTAMELYNFQRRLLELEQRGLIEHTGRGRGRRYRILPNDVSKTQPSSATGENAATEATTTEIVLSQEAFEIEAAVTRPEADRTPVNYNMGWVMSYRPNEDFYLTETERSKLHVIGVTPNTGQPAGTYAKQMLQPLLIDLSWNSSRLEGNTYSLLDTQRLLADGQPPPKKDPAETQMIMNHKDAIEFIVENAYDTGLNSYTIRNLHAMLAYNLLEDPSAPGRLRQHAVGIGKSVYTPLHIPAQIEEMFTKVLEIASAITDPFEQAFFVMVHLPYLQPFEDVNKRVSRLAANIPLNRNNLIPLSFIDVPKDLYIRGLLGVYELNMTTLLKELFIWAYERSVKQYAATQQTLGKPDPFRMQYSGTIRSLITNIIANNLSKEEAGQLITERAKDLPVSDRARLSESVERDLLGLHEGNFARYRATPNEFHTWQAHWGLNTRSGSA